MPSKHIQTLKREPCSTQSKSKTLVPQRRYGISVCMLIGHQFSEPCICSHCLPYHSMERWEFKRMHCTSQSRDCNYLLFNVLILFSYRTRFCDKLWGTRKWSFQAWTVDIPTILAILVFSCMSWSNTATAWKSRGYSKQQETDSDLISEMIRLKLLSAEWWCKVPNFSPKTQAATQLWWRPLLKRGPCFKRSI